MVEINPSSYGSITIDGKNYSHDVGGENHE